MEGGVKVGGKPQPAGAGKGLERLHGITFAPLLHPACAASDGV
jgi:hypothetical protein